MNFTHTRRIIIFMGALCLHVTMHTHVQETCPRITPSDILEHVYGTHRSSSFIQKNEYDELHLAELIERIRHTKTSCGEFGLNALLTPTFNLQTITHRQEVIRELVSNPEVHRKLSRTLQQSAHYEQFIADYWNGMHPLIAITNGLFFSRFMPFHETLNNSATSLEFGIAVEAGKSVTSFLQAMCLAGLGGTLQAWAYGRGSFPSIREGLFSGFNELIRNHNPMRTITMGPDPIAPYMFDRGTFGDRVEVVKHYIEKWKSPYIPLSPLLGGIVVSSIHAASFDAYTVYLARKSYSSVCDLYNTMNAMHDQLKKVHAWILHVEALHSLCQSSKHLQTTTAYTVLDDFVTQRNSSETMQRLYSSLKRDTFSSPATHVYSRGVTLLTHKLLIQAKQEFIPILHAVGDIDAYCSMATLYANQLTDTTPYTFVSFVEHAKPYLHIECGVSPLVHHTAQSSVTLNTITLGGHTPSHCLMTGPNACGKSIFIKLLGQTVALAQSCGIAPAHHVTMTPFHTLRTCFVSEESPGEGLSTFAAEVKRMHHLEQSITDHEDGPALVLIDEPYRGTIPPITAQCLHEFCEKTLLPSTHVISCIATHVEKPIALAHEHPAHFVNKHMDILFIGTTVERLFTIADGPATWWFTDEKKQNLYIEWFKKQYENQQLGAH